ncbi:MAG: hypothetical protein COW24_02975 [Candidatus Kerfeldbacteria bacterium CG15_BIG_FIL_POST_REV_8_21_14_020_45_12]|uniref:Fibronectin type-III domain-containing protein n=1 Tax=Candidatus Kerfeldbacteria bacterium CG15_BIG_FIL_POST_REV_8_21_14_020_45_12 TaxID=2014247 RepID=A0A2M7H3U0_9BACT|nr:MAG: hypothetical protein COW24_02975 [Candidatus Kerfeldbacteria bacterium CG15_BIG_FIL_POST_REV_8_21_14_020_45_12]PJA94020.1 MAG: hypothetical protein CO132_00545 [Candidatus Kerfeldbacteria bacterium CG_4_9_14_3_um_filter_45_8]
MPTQNLVTRSTVVGVVSLLGVLGFFSVAQAEPGIDSNPISSLVVEQSSVVTTESADYDITITIDEPIVPADFEGNEATSTPELVFFDGLDGSDEARGNLDFSNATITFDEDHGDLVYDTNMGVDGFTVIYNTDTTLPAADYSFHLSGVTSRSINAGFAGHFIGVAIYGFSTATDYCGGQYDRADGEFMCTLSDAFVLHNEDWAQDFGTLSVVKVKKRSATVKWEDANYWLGADSIKIQLKTKKGKRLKTYTIPRSDLYEGVSTKIISKKFLRKGRRYKVRARTFYDTGDMGDWSAYRSFKTKGKK